jgi:type IV secretion system T-DNA border endonuclease VirD2
MGDAEMSGDAALKTLFDTLGIFDSFDEFLHGRAGGSSAPLSRVRPRVRGQASNGRRTDRTDGAGVRRAIARVVRKAPEVMVKVSSVGKQAGRVWAHLTYVTRNGQIAAENDEGELLTGLEDMKELHDHWGEQIGKRRANGKQTVNMVLSMPAGTNAARLKEAIRNFAKQVFANHEYVFVLHTPETDPDPDAPPQPHGHLCVKARGKNGQRLVHGRAELQEWREIFAEKLRERGIEAAASPRGVRGIVKKPMRQSVYQSAKEDRSTIKAAIIDAAARTVLENREEHRPWEPRIAANQARIRQSWASLAELLERSPIPGDGELSTQVRDFLGGMPSPLTERQEIELRMREAMRKRAVLDASSPSAALKPLVGVSTEKRSGSSLRTAKRAKGKDQDLER